LKGLREQAESGQSDAQTTLAKFETTYPELSRMLGASDEELSSPNGAAAHWLSKAAAAGNPAAQFEIGRRNLGRADSLQSLMEAAKHGSTGAAVLLAAISEADGSVDGEIRALRWLQPTAKAGKGPAMKLLANLLASSDHDEVRDPSAAETLLKPLRDNKYFANDPNIWQMSAAAAAGRGDFKAAMHFQDEAVAGAKRLEWDLAPLLTRRSAYAMDRQDKGLVMANAVVMQNSELQGLTKLRDPVTGVPNVRGEMRPEMRR
jgi:TPR repeat protein